MRIEPPFSPRQSPVSFFADLTANHVINAVVASLFAVTGPVAIMLTVGSRGGISETDLASWIFGAFFLNGLISFALCLYYRQPLVFLWTIPGMVLVGPALAHLSFAEVVGAYYVTGLLILVLGISCWVRRCMDVFPMPIVMGMVAGVFLQFGLDWVHAFSDEAWIAAPMTIAFFGAAAMPAIANRFPPLIIALIVGLISVAALGKAPTADQISVTIAAPVFFAPAFSWQAIVELVVPLAITVLVVQNGQGIAILSAAGHKPPINAIAVLCGVWSVVVAMVGAVSTCLTGGVSGIIASDKDRAGQYTAGVIVSIFVTLFGLFAPLFTTVLLSTPRAFISTLAGIALLKVLQSAFTTAFQGAFSLGALVAFMVTISNLSLFNIGAPFWGLVFGFVASWVMERVDFGIAKKTG